METLAALAAAGGLMVFPEALATLHQHLHLKEIMGVLAAVVARMEKLLVVVVALVPLEVPLGQIILATAATEL